jgi:hypothetical protein
MIGILILLDSSQLGRTNREASVITDDLKTFERFDPFLLHLFENSLVTEKVEGVSDGNVSLIGKRDFLGMFLHLFLSHLKTAVTSHAGDEQLAGILLCDSKIPGGKIDGQRLVRTVRRASSATGPILQLMEMETESL